MIFTSGQVKRSLLTMRWTSSSDPAAAAVATTPPTSIS
jgi:hypothetical protein